MQQRRVLLPLQMQAPACIAADSRLLDLQGLSMGTSWSVKACVPPAIPDDDLQQAIQAQLDQVVAQMSPWKSDSDLMRFNRATANSWHHIPEQFYQVISHALFVAEQTQGAYDPSIGHLANLWGFGPDGKIEHAPHANTIAQARQFTDWQQLKIDHKVQRIYQPGNLHIDLCSTAKGYGVDQVARYLQERGIHSYLVEVSGELRGLGSKPDGQPWWVVLENLPASETNVENVVALHGLSVATSGDYRRYFEHQGQRYSHTIDPRTGYPVQHGVAAVTVIHPECMIADALATAMTVLGLEAGMAYAKQLHVAARFIVREGEALSEHLSPVFLEMMDEE
jgi:thiamine biosynthesis lipoprotein